MQQMCYPSAWPLSKLHTDTAAAESLDMQYSYGVLAVFSSMHVETSQWRSSLICARALCRGSNLHLLALL